MIRLFYLEDWLTLANLVFDDLWRLEPLTGTWYFVAGNSSGATVLVDYDYEGNGYIGSRSSFGAVVLSNDSIYIYGGQRPVVFLIPRETFNDLWRFDPLTNKWYFIFGNLSYPLGDYNKSGYPGARYYSSISLNPFDNSIVMFGGTGEISTNIFNYLNDLWIFNIAESIWQFVGGSIIPYAANTYNYSTGFGYPGARYAGSLFRLSNNSFY